MLSPQVQGLWGKLTLSPAQDVGEMKGRNLEETKRGTLKPAIQPSLHCLLVDNAQHTHKQKVTFFRRVSEKPYLMAETTSEE